MDLPQRSSCCDQICFFWVVSNTMHLSIMLDLVLHDDLIRHTIVIFANCFSGFEDLIFQLLADELLIGEIDLCHYEGVLLLA